MSIKQTITRYSLIINKLRKSSATLAEISDYLKLQSEIHGENYSFSPRTFQRLKDDIDNLFHIEIKFDSSKKVYYIHDDGQPQANARILEAFDTFNALNMSDRLSEYIHFEKRKPQGTEHLYGLLQAIKNRNQIQFTYQKYGEVALKKRQAEPYALKEFKNRWYVLANDLNDQKIKSFALDRITKLEMTNRKFDFPDDFNIKGHYRYCFGIISPNGHQPEEVILSFNPFQGKYIKSLPLHDSQEILIDNEEELRIKLNLFVTHDFFMELLSLGDNLKVLQPMSLIEDLKSTFSNIQKMYE